MNCSQIYMPAAPRHCNPSSRADTIWSACFVYSGYSLLVLDFYCLHCCIRWIFATVNISREKLICEIIFYRMWEAILTLAFVFWEEYSPIPFFAGNVPIPGAAFKNIVHMYCYCMSGYRRIDKKSTKTIQRTNKNCRKTNYACLLLDNIR